MSAEERREAIIDILCSRRHETIANLAFEFHVSRHTIEKDVLHLSLRYPIYTSKGTGGGVHVMEGRTIRQNRKFLTEEQLIFLQSLLPKLSKHEAEILTSIIRTYRDPKR